MDVLAGDVGGTHTRLARVVDSEAGPEIRDLRVFPSGEHGSLEEVVEIFTRDSDTPFQGGCLGVAGPVRSGRARTTNLPWRVEEEQLAEALGFEIRVINDLEATAWSIPHLSADQLFLLKDGTPDARGNGAVIAPGTGLGESGFVRSGTPWIPFPSEGGHTDFAPADDRESSLLTYLAARFGHVSWERVVSGPGLATVHQFHEERMPGQDLAGCPLKGGEGETAGPPAISQSAREGRCPACAAAMEQFCRSLGAAAGNLALTILATGGVWIAGGIAPDILDFLARNPFLEGFTSKGRMEDLMQEIPVRVILDETAPLLGAARLALEAGKGGGTR